MHTASIVAALIGLLVAVLVVGGLWWLSRRRSETTGVHRTPSPYAPTDVVEAVANHDANQAPPVFPATRAYGVVRPDHMQPHELGGGIPSMTLPPLPYGRHYRDETAEFPAVNGSPRHAGDA